MRKLASVAVVLFLFCLAPFHEVRADPAVVTSGSFVVQSTFFTFSMSGPNISFEGSGSSRVSNIGPVSSCAAPCTAVSLFSFTSGTDHIVSNVTHDGVFIPRLLPSQTGELLLRFDAPIVPIPSEFFNASGVIVTQPFTFTGVLAIVQPTGDVQHPLSGIGFVEVQLNRDTFSGVGRPGFLFQRASYNFVATPAELPPASIQAIPEPTTVILLSTGLAGLGAAVRKRRRQSRE